MKPWITSRNLLSQLIEHLGRNDSVVEENVQIVVKRSHDSLQLRLGIHRDEGP